MIEEFRTMESHIHRLEMTLAKRLRGDFRFRAYERNFQFGASSSKKMDDQIDAIRNTESVNQRLFDSLHQELIRLSR